MRSRLEKQRDLLMEMVEELLRSNWDNGWPSMRRYDTFEEYRAAVMSQLDPVEDDGEIERLKAWSDHLMDSGIVLADAVMNARENGYVLPAWLHNAAVNPLDMFLTERRERAKRAALKETE